MRMRLLSPFIFFALLVFLVSVACDQSGSVATAVPQSEDEVYVESSAPAEAPAATYSEALEPTVPESQPAAPVEPDYQAEVLRLEEQHWNTLAPQINIQPLTDEDRSAINGMLSGGANIDFGSVTADSNGTVQLAAIGDPNVILIPMAQMRPDDLTAFYNSLQAAKPLADNMWFSLFHWTNHMANPYALSANSAWVAQIVRGGITGFGEVYYFAGGGGMQDQYLFVTKLAESSGQVRIWATFLAAENGAVVTSYNPGMRHGVYTAQEAARFMARMQARGYTLMDGSQVPQHIKDTWGGNAPSIWRHLYWSLGYQLRLAAAAAQLTIPAAIEAMLQWIGTTITDFVPLIFIVPEDPCMFLPATCQIKS